MMRREFGKEEHLRLELQHVETEEEREMREEMEYVDYCYEQEELLEESEDFCE